MSVTRETACEFDLGRLMRRHKVTIRELSKRMNVTMKAIRRVRAMDRVDYLTYCDYTEGVTGEVVFNRARYEAMQDQARSLS